MLLKTRAKLAAGYGYGIRYEKVRFLIVGSVGFVVNYVALAVLYDLLNMPIIVAQIIGAESAVLTSFAGNYLWTFSGHQNNPMWKKMIRFHISALTGLAINSTTVVLLVQFTGLHYGLALVIGSVTGLVWNYSLYKRFVFK